MLLRLRQANPLNEVRWPDEKVCTAIDNFEYQGKVRSFSM